MDTSTFDRFSDIKSDPLYLEGMQHMQAGQWNQAIHCFESLTQKRGITQPVQKALNEARFKARLDQNTRVRAKRWIIPWRRLVIVMLTLTLLGFGAIRGARFVNMELAPALARAQETRQNEQLLKEARTYLEAGKLTQAEISFRTLLTRVPDHSEALAALDTIAERRMVQELCAAAMASYEAGDLLKAREQFTELMVRDSRACEASRYIAEINRRLSISDLFAQAEAAFSAGEYTVASRLYEQISEINATYRRQEIDERLYTCYLAMGKSLIMEESPSAESVTSALDYFTKALAKRPRDVEASTEQRLANLFLAGRLDYTEGRWDAAASRLGIVYDTRPNYLQGSYVGMLYDALIRSGDQHRDQQDYHFAWEQYRRASELNYGDRVLALGRMATVVPFLTPTSTPTHTPTSTPTFTPTPIPTATPLPTSTFTPLPTPTVTLKLLHGKIVFFSDQEGQRGMWVMNPDGTNRRYLGNDKSLRDQYQELLQRDSFSPDGRYRVYVTKTDDPSPQIYIQGQVDQWGHAPTWKVTDFRRVSYDPVWSPDGAWIAFVSQEKGSDDIWVVRPDGSDPKNLTPNTWEWDKHPSWSPDGTRIVFWSNRTGVKQIYVMNADGRNLVRLSETEWDEYDPLWVKIR